MRPKAEWAIDSEAMRARGIIVLVKQLVVYYGQTERALKTRVSEHKKAVLMFDHNSKLACHVHEHHHHMDFENVEVVGHEEHYHQRLFLEAWMSVKDPNAGNDHMVIPEVYKCLART